MQKVTNPKILACLLIGINVFGLLVIHNDLTKGTQATVRLISLSALPTTEDANRITLSFDRELVPPDDVGKIEKASLFKLTPDWPGEWVWSASDKLDYVLSERLPAGRIFKVSSTPELRAKTGRTLDGQDKFELKTTALKLVRSELVAFDPGNVTFRVVFNQPVDPGDLVRHLSFYDEQGKRKLGETVCLTQKPQEELVVRFTHPGSNRFEMVLDEGLTGYNAELGLEAKVTESFDIPKNFCLLNVHASRPNLDEIAWIEMEFSHELNKEQKLPDVKIEPAVDDMIVSRNYSNLHITGKFKAGSKYTITVPGILMSENNKTLAEDKTVQVFIPEYEPDFHFEYSQGILSPFGNLKLDVKAVNIGGLKLTAWRVHANNIVSYLKDEYYSESTSRLVLTKDFKTDFTANKPQSLVLDLNGLLPQKTGIYSINANVTNSRWTSDRAFVTITDLAITAKAERDSSLVWVTSLRTGEPVPDVKVKALTFNNQTLSSELTDSNGLARLKFASSRPDGDVWVITAEKGDDLNYLKPQENQWVIDNVPQSGRPFVRNYEVMLYTERGVYRPGETMHITGIIRGKMGDAPPPFSLSVKVTRPDGRQVADLIAKPLSTDQGVFHVDFPTRSDCQTGPYEIRVTIPGEDESLGEIQTSVECFVPVRMKVTAEMSSVRYGPNEVPSLKANGRYLWDEPASALPLSVTGTVLSLEYKSKVYPQYRFNCEPATKTVTLPDLNYQLDSNGLAEAEVNIPDSLQSGLYRILLSATVTEIGGRSVSANTSAILDTLDRHIGLKMPSGQVVPVGNPVEVNWVRLTGEDKPAPSSGLTMSLFRVEYDTVLKLVKDRQVWVSNERLIKVGDEQSLSEPGAEGNFEIVCPDPGSYRVVITDVQTKSSSRLDFYASTYFDGPQSVPMNQPERLNIITDRDSYSPGQTAKVVLKSPIAGRFLFTVENDSVVLDYSGRIQNNTAELQIPLSKELRGTVYLTASVVRAVDPNQENWLPHRAVGMARILLDHSQNEIPVQITGPNNAEPGDTVSVTVDAGTPADSNCPALVHIWAVDEGILLTTDYETPSPFEFFLGPRRIGVSTSDIFLRLLPDHKRPAEITRIGADHDEINSLRRSSVPIKYRQSAVVWQEAKPVDKNGQVKAEFKLPDLVGQMRFMAVVVDKDRYAKNEHKMTLASPLVAEVTWPRFAAPQDEFDVPVKLFNSTDKPVTVQVTVSVSEQIEIAADEALKNVLLNPEKPVTLMLKARALKSGVVDASVLLKEIGAADKPLTSQNIATFSVRPAAALHSEIEIYSVKAGEQLIIQPSKSFLEGTALMTISVSSNPGIQLGPALEKVIHYPYGCVEQTSSQLFSLLYASNVLGSDRAEMIDSMVKAGIARLWSMQTRSGGLSYWPGDSTPNLWGTAYAASCLLEAKNAGYEIDKQFTDELVKYLEQCLKTTGDDSPDINTKALICRVLAVFGEPPSGWMTRLAEQKEELDIAGRSHLAAAYHATGKTDFAKTLLPEKLPLSFGVSTTSGRLISSVRQQAVLLSVLLDIDPENPSVAVLARRLDESRKDSEWGSTLNNAAVIASLSRYQAKTGKVEQNFSGKMTLAGQEEVAFDSNTPVLRKFNDINEPVTISSNGTGMLYVVVTHEGLAKKGIIKPFDSGLKVVRGWFDRNGNPLGNDIHVGDLIQVVTTIRSPEQTVNNVAIVDALPGGMEIENPHLATSAQSSESETDSPEHIEFLDDRVVIFCTTSNNLREFRYSLRVTASGKFALPPIQASCMYDPAFASLGPEGDIIINNNQTVKTK